MNLKKRLFLFAAVVMAASNARADLFPFSVGYRWEFDFVRIERWVDTVLVDSGTVEWEIVSIRQTASIPPHINITVEQTKSLERSIATSFNPNPYDSIYRPPQVTVDTLDINGTEGMNGWTRGTDTCWTFINDETVPGTDSMVDIRSTKLFYDGDSLDAFAVDPAPCQDREVRPDSGFVLLRSGADYFTLSHGLGPVGYFYYRDLYPGIDDYFLSESWSLTYTNADGRSGIPGRKGLNFHSGWNAKLNGAKLTLQLLENTELSAEAIGLNGRRITLLTNGLYPGGRYIIDLEPSLQSRPWVLRVKRGGRTESQLMGSGNYD